LETFFSTSNFSNGAHQISGSACAVTNRITPGMNRRFSGNRQETSRSFRILAIRPLESG
jgi:hypothetical protein